MPTSQRTEIVRLSSTNVKNMPITDLSAFNIDDDDDIPSCGVDIVPRSRPSNVESAIKSRLADGISLIVTPSIIRKPSSHLQSAGKAEDDEYAESVAHKNALELREEKEKAERQLKGRAYAKEQRRRWRLEALQLKEEAEQEKRNRAERLTALGQKARKFACEPMPEYPRQQLAKSRTEVRRKVEVYVPPPEEDENDVSVYALQWALGEEGAWQKENVSHNGVSPDSVDLHSDTGHGTEPRAGAEYSAESKNEEQHDYSHFENDSEAPQYVRSARFEAPKERKSAQYQSSSSNTAGKEMTNAKSVTTSRVTDMQSAANKEISIFEQGMINNMGRIPAKLISKSVPENIPRKISKKPKKEKASIKMFSPSYRQVPVPSLKPKLSTNNIKSVRTTTTAQHASRIANPKSSSVTPTQTPSHTQGHTQGHAQAHTQASSGSRSRSSSVTRVYVRDTKGNIVRQIVKIIPVAQQKSGQ
jgi:hypothetical protein